MEIPVMLNVANRRCLVIGGGQVGLRKARLLAEAGAEVLLLSPSIKGDLPPAVTLIQEAYSRARLEALSPWLVVAATDSSDTNRQVQDDARRANILVMRADEPKIGDVYGIQFRRQGEILLAAVTGSPLFTRALLDLLEAQITPALVTYANWLKKLRSAGKKQLADPAERMALWRRIAASAVLERLQNGDESGAKSELATLTGAELSEDLG